MSTSLETLGKVVELALKRRDEALAASRQSRQVRRAQARKNPD